MNSFPTQQFHHWKPTSTKSRPKRRSPLSRAISMTVPSVPRTIYSLKKPSTLSRANSLPAFYAYQTPDCTTSLPPLPQTPPSQKASGPIWLHMPPTPPESSMAQPRYPRGFRRAHTLEWACARERERDVIPPLDLDYRPDMMIYRDHHEGTSSSTSPSTEDEMELLTPSSSFSITLPEIVVSPADEFYPRSQEDTDAATILLALGKLQT